MQEKKHKQEREREQEKLKKMYKTLGNEYSSTKQKKKYEEEHFIFLYR